ncbi:hypothetical protein DINM_000119 [Dirofilaria immitis]|nr:hypothetical protein [Dirofilaria immitis]
MLPSSVMLNMILIRQASDLGLFVQRTEVTLMLPREWFGFVFMGNTCDGRFHLSEHVVSLSVGYEMSEANRLDIVLDNCGLELFQHLYCQVIIDDYGVKSLFSRKNMLGFVSDVTSVEISVGQSKC